MQISKPLKVSTHTTTYDVNGDIKTDYLWKQEVRIPEGHVARVLTLWGETKRELAEKLARVS